MPDIDFLVVGGGAAGWSCATTLRQLGADGSVVLVGRELDAPYDRTLCSKSYLAGTAVDADAQRLRHQVVAGVVARDHREAGGPFRHAVERIELESHATERG